MRSSMMRAGVVLALTGAIAGVSGSIVTAQDPAQIAYLSASSANTWLATSKVAMDEVAAANGMELTEFDAQFNADLQTTQLQDVISSGQYQGIIVSALNGVAAQRLVRVICSACGEDHAPTTELLAESGLDAAAVQGFRFRIGRGCGQCRGSGYKGRKAIAEFLVMNDELRELIVSRESIRSVKAAAARHGTRLLRQTAMDLVRNGETTLQEINRVTFVS